MTTSDQDRTVDSLGEIFGELEVSPTRGVLESIRVVAIHRDEAFLVTEDGGVLDPEGYREICPPGEVDAWAAGVTV